MFCPPTLTKIPSGQPGSPGLNGGFLDSLEFLARRWQNGKSQPMLVPSCSSPFSSPFQQGSPAIHMEPSAHTSKSFPAPQHLPLVDSLSLGCNIPAPESPLEGMTWTRPALGLEQAWGCLGREFWGPMHCSKKRDAMLFASNS